MIYKTYYDSPVGKLFIASDGENIIGLCIEGQKYYLNKLEKEGILENDLPIFDKTRKWLDSYFKQEKPKISELSLAPEGNVFRQSVWEFLCKIPYGETITYGELAKKVAKKLNKSSMSAQAIGNAVGHNPISIIIPCHRVVGKNGNLTGYAGGIDKKIKLLKHEGININKFFIPKHKSKKKKRKNYMSNWGRFCLGHFELNM